MIHFFLIFATVFLPATATTIGDGLPLSASVQFSAAVLQDLLTLPLPALQQLAHVLQVPSSTDGCSTGLDGGQMVSWLKWGSGASVTFGPNGAVKASANVLSMGGSMSVRVQGCSFLCLSCIFQSNTTVVALDTTPSGLGCPWFDCCCSFCKADIDWEVDGIGYDVEFTVGRSGDSVSAIVQTASITTNWESIDISKLSCNVLWGLIKITFTNIWVGAIPGLTVSLTPVIQAGLDAVFGLVTHVVCDATTIPDTNHFLITTYQSGSTDQCMQLPPITVFPMDPRDISIVVLLSMPIPWFLSGFLCSPTQPMCLEVANLPAPFNGVTVGMQNCQICVGVQPTGIYLGISADITVGGLPETSSKPRRPQRQQLSHFPRRPARFRRLHEEDVEPRRAVSLMVSNCSVVITSQALTYAVSEAASVISQNMASFHHEARDCEQFAELSMCCITFPGFTYAQFASVDPTPSVEILLNTQSSIASLRITLPNVATTFSTVVPVSEIMCLVPTPMLTVLTQSSTGTITVDATTNGGPIAFDITMGVVGGALVVTGAGLAPSTNFTTVGTITTPAGNTFVFDAFAKLYTTGLAAEMQNSLAALLLDGMLAPIKETLTAWASRFSGVCQLSSSGTIVVNSGSACAAGFAPSPAVSSGLSFVIAAGPAPTNVNVSSAMSHQQVAQCSEVLPAVSSLAPGAQLTGCDMQVSVLNGQVFVTVDASLIGI